MNNSKDVYDEYAFPMNGSNPTDYSTWALKDEDAELLYGPSVDEGGWWCFVYKKNGLIKSCSGLPDYTIELNFKPPVVWTYYREAGYGSRLRAGTLSPIFTCAETHVRATHKSCDGGDTIERISPEMVSV